MYAVAEFLKGVNKEYAVVPVIWLFDNNKMCYWPRVKTEAELVKLIRENSPYNKKWPKYKVHKILKTSESYNSLQADLSDILEQSTTESGGSALQFKVVTDHSLHEQLIETNNEGLSTVENKDKITNENGKRKYKKKRSKYKKSRKSRSPPKKRQRKSSSSSITDTDDVENVSNGNESEFPTVSNKCKINQKHREALTEIPNTSLQRSSTPLNNIMIGSLDSGSKNSNSSPFFPRSITNVRLTEMALINNQPPGSFRNSVINTEPVDMALTNHPPRSGQVNEENLQTLATISETPSAGYLKSKVLSQKDFHIEVLTRLRIVVNEIAQINVSLSQLARSAQFGNVETVVKPDGFLSLPIGTLADFRTFDQNLKIEVYETYFINRLATIGGMNVRQGVMNILKFAITNKLAMEFNWAGRDQKLPFSVTQMAKIITAAIKIRFRDSPDSADTNISAAIKDWLKQAKHRNRCSKK